MNVRILGSTEQEIHVVIKVHNSNSPWLFSGIYASPRFRERKILWGNLESIAESVDVPWVVLGDFNEVLSESEKYGGRGVCFNRAARFNEMLNNCSLTDLGFYGPRFTWTNMRQTGGFIHERLDRAVANPSWRLKFPNAEVRHLPRVHSDHCPILLDFNPKRPGFFDKPFRFETMWLSHPDFDKVVMEAWDEGGQILQESIKAFHQKAFQWNKEVFGNIFQKKRQILARLAGIQRKLSFKPLDFLINLERSLRGQYQELLKNEREFWLLTSRTDWILEGERNTRFFHASTVINRRKNKISGLKNEGGNGFLIRTD